MEENIQLPKNKAIFLDRDGVLNLERGDYTWRLSDFEVCPGVPEALAMLKKAGYYLIVVTNQAGVAKGIYSKSDVLACHEKLQRECGNLLDALYMAPGHPNFSESLARKPNSLMLEKAMARFNIDPAHSWLVGDKMRDVEAAFKVGVKSILVGEYPPTTHQWQAKDLLEAAHFITMEH
ncbi:D-glycero-alpha-D-manno-heptose-1,7-bisphosphate 7-phosphatase [Rufibacter roseus]|uniref:D,D-heptose 1,7-bisphosphate phosphatase n=1 Tax=Rufibacter roseus TaxID=1567108 RepID=A0ABW2DS61_9BACT|nr:HAD family hydrolase [Rufibacter roseus]